MKKLDNVKSKEVVAGWKCVVVIGKIGLICWS
ncbi:hypothetical protein A5880_001766 [Enterococcus sp. 4G2_DIV0659]|uniref:Uncharacterized protein n=3 Tax=Candidatus Enterococcus mansonii TaxID=1834181 RepID=A0A242CEL8_9ENTE|nr:hypothetical protein A5880_001683 [Enterococcus sp. 4G2_DIV0659]